MFRVFMLVVALAFILSCGGDVASNAMNGNTGSSNGGSRGQPETRQLLDTVYVDGSIDNGGNGTTWDNAFKTLQAGIKAAEEITKRGNGYVRVHVAVGIYKPTSRPNPGVNPGNARTMHFSLKNNVEVVGGYKVTGNTATRTDATETTLDSDKTILSGEGATTADTDNVYHVFYHPYGANLISSAKLENVTITKGNATGAIDRTDNGGGMYNDNSSPELTNVNFTSNIATSDGGGMHNTNSSPKLTKVTFTKNRASRLGGGMFNTGSSPTLTGGKFENNTVDLYGGGMYNGNKSSPTLNTVTFKDNTATKAGGGGMYNGDSSPTLENVNFTNNKATNGEGGGMYNIGTSNPSLTGGKFEGNKASISGGGMYNENSSPTLNGVTFEANKAINGGGMYNEVSSPTFTSVCTFTGNKATGEATATDGKGGAIYNDKNSTITNPGNAQDGGGKGITSIIADNGKENGYYQEP